MSSHSDPTNYMRHKSSPTGTYSSIPRLTQTLHQPLNLSPTCTLDFNKTSFTKNLFICDLLSLSHLVQLSFEGEVYHHHYYYYSSVPVLQNGAFFFSTDPQQQCMRTLSHSPQKLTRWWRRRWKQNKKKKSAICTALSCLRYLAVVEQSSDTDS